MTNIIAGIKTWGKNMQPVSEQIKSALAGNNTDEIEFVARTERKSTDFVRRNVANGRIVILYDKKRKIDPVGCGVKLRTKVNVNVGTSTYECNPSREIKRAIAAEKYGADRIMDLSTAGDIVGLRKKLLTLSHLPLGAVTVYEACRKSIEKYHSFVDAPEDMFLRTLEEQIESGINYITVHLDLTYELLKKALRSKRIIKIPARGGVLLAGWMLHNKSENPYHRNFEYLCEILGKHDVCLSLGNSLRAGTVCDALDNIEREGIFAAGRLIRKARKAGIQTQLESGSHIPLAKIEPFVNLVKSVCCQAPMGTLGPLVTDIGAGYDHVVQAIGQALGVRVGLDYVTAVTRSEHIGLPRICDTVEGLIAARLAVHAGMSARFPSSMNLDRKFSNARAAVDYDKQMKLVFDCGAVERIRKRYPKADECSMCGDFCAIRLLRDYKGGVMERKI